MSPVPPAQRVFPEGLRVYQPHLLNCRLSSKAVNCNQFFFFLAIGFSVLKSGLIFPYFLNETRNKKRARTHTYSRRAGASHCEPFIVIQKIYSEA